MLRRNFRRTMIQVLAGPVVVRPAQARTRRLRSRPLPWPGFNTTRAKPSGRCWRPARRSRSCASRPGRLQRSEARLRAASRQRRGGATARRGCEARGADRVVARIARSVAADRDRGRALNSEHLIAGVGYRSGFAGSLCIGNDTKRHDFR